MKQIEEITEQTVFEQIPHFEEAHQITDTGSQLQKIKEVIPSFKQWFKETGEAGSFHSIYLIKIPFIMLYGLWRAVKTPALFIWFKNRMFIVQWKADGRTWTSLKDITEPVLAEGAPFYSELIE